MTPGPCLCGDPTCGRCFPSQPVFRARDLSDVVASWAYRHSTADPAASLAALDDDDVAWLIELTIYAVLSKLADPGAGAVTERLIISDLGRLILETVRVHEPEMRA